MDKVLEKNTDRAHGVVVSRDGELNFARISVGINDSDDGDVEAFCFGNRDGFLGNVHDDEGVWFVFHVPHSVEIAAELLLLAVQRGEFLFGHELVFRSTLDVLEIFHASDRLADGCEIGHGATEPAMVDVELTGSFSSFTDGVLSLALASYKEDLFAPRGESGKEVSGLIEALDRLFEVDDIDAALILHKVRLHLGIPFLGLVTVVDTSLDHFFNEFVNHFVFGPTLKHVGAVVEKLPLWSFLVLRCL
jgi:hypothetical protein